MSNTEPIAQTDDGAKVTRIADAVKRNIDILGGKMGWFWK
jgi:hypothetical protein